MQVLPAAQVVDPEYPIPPHWPHLLTVTVLMVVEVAALLLLLVVEAFVDVDVVFVDDVVAFVDVEVVIPPTLVELEVALEVALETALDAALETEATLEPDGAAQPSRQPVPAEAKVEPMGPNLMLE